MKPQKIIISIAALVAVLLFCSFDLQRFMTLAAHKANRQTLLDYYAAHKLIMGTVYAGDV